MGTRTHGRRQKLRRWDPQHEIDERRLVRPEDFLRTLSWGSAPSAAIILAEGLKAEAEAEDRVDSPPGAAAIPD